MNLCRVKEVNETLGHDVGDWLINEAAKRLASIKDITLLTHLGGDEFVILCKNVTEQAQNNLQKIVNETLDSGCDYRGVRLPLQMRFGISAYPQHSSDVKRLLQMADMALHHARKVNQHAQVYHDALQVNSVERLNLINDLKTAIAEQQLVLFYQPKVSLNSKKVTHVEALVRWQHPTLGMLPPDEFIYIAEQTGQIDALTQCVFLMAVEQFTRWRDNNIHVNVAVNISAENLKNPDFLALSLTPSITTT